MDYGVKFYGATDGSTTFQLKKSKEIIKSFDDKKNYTDINEIIELYNIKRYFDDGMLLDEWSEGEKEQYTDTVKKFNSIIGIFFSKINGQNVIRFYEATDIDYHEDFWGLVEEYKGYEKISSEEFKRVIEKHPNLMRCILRHRKIVYKFDEEITKTMLSDERCAELIIGHFTQKKSSDQERIYIPKTLSDEEKKKILYNYIKWKKVNPNYLSLIITAKGCTDMGVDDRIRYAAQKRYKRFWQDNQGKMTAPLTYGVDVSFYDDSIEKKQMVEYDSGIKKLSYGTTWIDQNTDYPTLLNNFIYLFGYVDMQYRCTFLSNESKLGIFERFLGIRGEKKYETGMYYNMRQMESSMQMAGYVRYLKEKGIYIENIFKWFFETYLKNEFSAEGFSYIEPSTNASVLEKILVLVPQLDGIMKQYRIFIEDRYIDREYFEFASDNYRLTKVHSMISNKYVYANNNEIKRAMFLMFSDQSMLYFVKDKTYDSLPELIQDRKMRKADFEEYNRGDLEFLLAEKYIFLDKDGYIKLNMNRTALLKDFFDNNVLSYAEYVLRNKNKAKIIQEWIEEGKVIVENTLFTKQEQDYIDFVLNVKQFGNGPELRNKYAHGTFPIDEKQQYMDYIELLKIMMLYILKINEEFCLKCNDTEE